MAGRVESMYKVTPPVGVAFRARIIDAGGGVAGVESDRQGTWAPETQLTVADLVMPEQSLAEWGVEEET